MPAGTRYRRNRRAGGGDTVEIPGVQMPSPGPDDGGESPDGGVIGPPYHGGPIPDYPPKELADIPIDRSPPPPSGGGGMHLPPLPPPPPAAAPSPPPNLAIAPSPTAFSGSFASPGSAGAAALGGLAGARANGGPTGPLSFGAGTPLAGGVPGGAIPPEELLRLLMMAGGR